MAELRTVRALEDDLNDEGVNVLMVELQTDAGVELFRRFETNITPTFIILDADGQEKWRGHRMPSEADIVDYFRS